MAAHYVQLARRAMAAGSEFHSRPNRWGDRSILHKFTSSTLALTHSAWGEFSARVVIPDLSPVDVLAVPRAAAVLHKAARGPATRSGLDRRLQPIGGRRVQDRASQRSRDKRAVVTNLRIASGCWFLVDAEVDPDGFQRNRRRNLATTARVDLCNPTPFRRCRTSWARFISTLWHPQRPRSASVRVPIYCRLYHSTIPRALRECLLAQDVARVLGTGEPLDYVSILCTPAVYDRTHSPAPGRVSGLSLIHI